jgi:hypothetical protein
MELRSPEGRVGFDSLAVWTLESLLRHVRLYEARGDGSYGDAWPHHPDSVSIHAAAKKAECSSLTVPAQGLCQGLRQLDGQGLAARTTQTKACEGDMPAAYN